MQRQTQRDSALGASATGWPHGRLSSLAAILASLLMFVVALTSLSARAEDELPGRVGRVANLQGVLRHAPGDSADSWAEIGLNYPIAEGDNLWVEHDGRAEVDYGGGQFRLAGDTNVHVSRLDDRQLSLFIASGRMIVRVRVLERDDSVRVDTPATQIELTRPGLYRIDVAQDAPRTTLVVREGEAQVYSGGNAEQVRPGQTALITGVADEVPEVRAGGGIDGFDAWSAARDRVYEQPRQNAYVSPQMVGASDLDAYGTWRVYPNYGAVWFPTDVSPAWAPYRHGYWTWLPGWGYAWVDYAPWGYAPFHYGRWAFIGGRWGWCPGAFVARPLWAPALVAWYGGPGWTLTASGGPVYGWIPLAWGEPYVPWWGACSSRCWARYNHPYGLNVAERRDAPPSRYVNARVPGGLTAVDGATLASGSPVAAHRVSVARGVDVGAPLVRAPDVKPIAPALATVRTGANAPQPASILSRRLETTPIAGPDQEPRLDRNVREPIAPINPARAGYVGEPASRSAGGAPIVEVVPPGGVRRPVTRPMPSRETGSIAQNIPAPVAPPASAGVGTSPPDPSSMREPRLATPSEEPASRIAPARPTERLGTLPRAVPPASGALPAPGQPAVTPAPRTVPAPVAPATPAMRTVPAPVAPATPALRSVPAPSPLGLTPTPAPGAVVPGVPPGAIAPGVPPGAAAPSAPQVNRAPVRPAPSNAGADR